MTKLDERLVKQAPKDLQEIFEKMEDAMELSITSNEIFDNFLQGKCDDAAEQGRKEGEKIGEERGKISAVLDLYIAGFIARDVATAQLGVTDQEFETLLQSRS